MARKATKEPLPYYRWYWRDWRSNRRVQRMSHQARAIYRELLDEFWAEGSLPTEIDALADISGWPKEDVEKFWPEIEPCFVLINGVLINPKMDEQRTETDALRAANARNGKAGAIAKMASVDDRQADARDSTATASDRQRPPSERHIAVAIAEQEHTQSKKQAAPEARVEYETPEWVDRKALERFLAMRKKNRKPVTAEALPLLVKKLESLRRAGHDPTAVLDQSTMNGWQGLFEVRGGSNGTSQDNRSGSRGVSRVSEAMRELGRAGVDLAPRQPEESPPDLCSAPRRSDAGGDAGVVLQGADPRI